MFSSFGPLIKGVCLSLLAFTVFVCSDALAKIAGLAGFSPLFIVIVSSWSAGLFALCYLGARGKVRRLLPVRVKPHFIRAALYLGEFFACVICFTNLPLTSVYITLFMGPLLITMFGAFFMGEPINKKQFMAILIGFAGVVLALFPHQETAYVAGENHTLGYLVLPFTLVLFVTNMLYLRVMGRTETAESMGVNPFIIRAVFLLPALFFVMPETITVGPFLCCVALGLTSSLGFVLISNAYKIAPVAVVSPLHYTQLLTGAFLGYVLWGTLPTKWTFAGGVFIILSGLIVAREAHRQERERASAQLLHYDLLQQEQA